MGHISSKSVGILYQSLTEGEKKQLAIWLQMELAADKRNVRKYEAQKLLEELNRLPLKYWENRRIWKGIHPKQGYNRVKMAKILAALCESIELFLAMKTLKQDNTKRNRLVIQSLEARKRFDEASQIRRNFEKISRPKIAIVKHQNKL